MYVVLDSTNAIVGVTDSITLANVLCNTYEYRYVPVTVLSNKTRCVSADVERRHKSKTTTIYTPRVSEYNLESDLPLPYHVVTKFDTSVTYTVFASNQQELYAYIQENLQLFIQDDNESIT